MSYLGFGMRDQIITNFSATIDKDIAVDLIDSYLQVVTEYRKGNIAGSLSAAGMFVENTLRAVECIRTGVALSEIKNAASTKSAIEKDESLPESLRILIPRVAMAMIYDIRSKRGAVHVKDIDPKQIDASLAVHSASWIIAEFLRLFHVSGEDEVRQAMASLMRTYVPLVESIEDEVVVTRPVKCELEILLLLIAAAGGGLDRRQLGRSCKQKPSTISNALKRLESDRSIHKAPRDKFHITGSGEQRAAELLSLSN